MLGQFLKRNNLLISFILPCIVLLGLALFQIDRQYYQNEKRRLILDNISVFIDEGLGRGNKEQLALLARDELLGRGGAETHRKLVELVNDVLAGPSIVYRVRVKRESPSGASNALAALATTTASAQAAGKEVWLLDLPPARHTQQKLLRFNTWSNSLLLRDFSGTVAQPIEDFSGNQIGRLIVYYTTPVGDPDIEELTRRYRWYALFMVIIFCGVAYAIARWGLLPFRRVINAIEDSTPSRTLFLAQSGTRLETLYNHMALESVVARLQAHMREEITRNPQMTGWEVVERACQSFAGQTGAPLAAALELVAEGPGRLRASGRYVLAGELAPPASGSTDAAAVAESPAPAFETPFGTEGLAAGPALARELDTAFPRDGRATAPFEIAALDEQGVPLRGTLSLARDPEREGIRYLFALVPPALEGEAAEQGTMLEELAGLANLGLQTLSQRNRLLVQERGRANISLSRNLGHDLTNIIATSKLELMALERVLGGGEAPTDGRRRAILLESLHGLLSSVRFMQETVNLYRAYAFLQHPVLEVHDANQLIGDTLDLFAMSTSATLELRRELATDAPRCYVDPRLIKLALFNLFTNALEAIRKTDPDHQAQGWIRVATRRMEDGGLGIVIEDSGTGILKPDGQRAAPHEVEQIFALGYTSQRASGGQGEGLGLAWVRQIVQELHGGRIRAENAEGPSAHLPAGAVPTYTGEPSAPAARAGARFILTFPPITAEAAAPATHGS